MLNPSMIKVKYLGDVKEYRTLDFKGLLEDIRYEDSILLNMENGTFARWDPEKGWTGNNKFLTNLLIMHEFDHKVEDGTFSIKEDVVLAIKREEKFFLERGHSRRLKEIFPCEEHSIYKTVILHKDVKS